MTRLEDVFPGIDPERVKALTAHPAFQAALALVRSGKDYASDPTLSDQYTETMEGLHFQLEAAGYSHAEISAAYMLQLNNVE